MFALDVIIDVYVKWNATSEIDVLWYAHLPTSEIDVEAKWALPIDVFDKVEFWN
jgi:hypothetical protein